MAVREFKDKKGTTWRAWDVTPETLVPATKSEEYLADCFRHGWIVFENLDTGDKRRLSPFPVDWDAMTDAQLEALLWLDAEPVVARKKIDLPVPVEPPCDDEDDAVRAARLGEIQMGALGIVRGFLYPGGRVWDVRVVAEPGTPAVLRFQSGLRRIDLDRWPAEWGDFTDAQLVELLRASAPRAERWRAGLPRRRHGDGDESAGARP